MMKAKDTVMSNAECVTIIDRWLDGELEASHVSETIAEAQAEISFKAGKEEGLKDIKKILKSADIAQQNLLKASKDCYGAGIREVVGWIEQNMIYLDWRSSERWEAQKKKWGIE